MLTTTHSNNLLVKEVERIMANFGNNKTQQTNQKQILLAIDNITSSDNVEALQKLFDLGFQEKKHLAHKKTAHNSNILAPVDTIGRLVIFHKAHKCFKVLLDNEYDFTQLINLEQETFLSYAIRTGRYTMAKMLIRRGLVDINHQDIKGQTALYHAVYVRDPAYQTLQLLIDKKVNIHYPGKDTFSKHKHNILFVFMTRVFTYLDGHKKDNQIIDLIASRLDIDNYQAFCEMRDVCLPHMRDLPLIMTAQSNILHFQEFLSSIDIRVEQIKLQSSLNPVALDKTNSKPQKFKI